MELGKEILPKVGVMVIVLFVFIGLSSIHGFSSQVPIEKRIDRVLVANPQFMDSIDCSMWIENMTVTPGETYTIPIYGEWFFTISAYQVCLQFNNSIVEIIDVRWATTIGHDAFVQDWIFPYPDVLLIGVAWMPGSYKSAGSGILVFLDVNISEQIQPGETILDLSNLGGILHFDCIYADEGSNVFFPELFDGTLFVYPGCGDIDGNSNGPDIADLVYLVDFMFQGGPPPIPDPCVADVNGDGNGPDIADLVYLVEYMFQGGPPVVNDCCG